jgi:hypothetical protein
MRGDANGRGSLLPALVWLLTGACSSSAGDGRGSGGGSGTGGALGSGGTSSGGSNASGGAPSASGGGGGKATGGSRGSGGSGGNDGSGGATSAGGGGSSAGGGGVAASGGAGGTTASSYDRLILAEAPVAYWAMNKGSGTEPDLTGHNNSGTYKNGPVTTTSLQNGDQAADFNGSNQYLTVPSSASFSIPTTGTLTWEAWIRPDVLQFPHDSGGYVDWMGKCQDYGGSCEWEARMYSTDNSENRSNRLSAYVFNTSAGLGSAADWQPKSGLVKAGTWYHVVGSYTTKVTPADCANAAMYPGSIDIWVDGVKWNHGSHGQTGCMSQYNVVPVAKNSPLNIGTMAMDAWFPGSIAKVAIYDRSLTQAQITAHYQAMTGLDPTGSCAAECNF